MQKVISYNEREVRKGGSRQDISRGYNVWVDLVDPSEDEIRKTQKAFGLDEKCLEQCLNRSKKPEVRMLDKQVFTVFCR